MNLQIFEALIIAREYLKHHGTPYRSEKAALTALDAAIEMIKLHSGSEEWLREKLNDPKEDLRS